MKNSMLYSVLMSLITVLCATSPCVAQDVPCLYTLNPPNQAIGAGGGNENGVTVNTTARCRWAAVSHDAWVSIVSGSDRTGTGSVKYTVAVNPGPNARRGTMTIAGKTFRVAQASPLPAPCTITIPQGATVGAYAGLYSFVLSASTGECAWSVVSSVPWITIVSEPAEKGSRSVGYQVAVNPEPTLRVGRILVNGKHFLITQKSPFP